jgi:hypothetical protein
MAERNPYLDLMEDEEPKSKARIVTPAQTKAPHVEVNTAPAEAPQEAKSPEQNVYEALMEEEPVLHDMRLSLPGAAAGAATGYLTTGAAFRPFSPPPSLVNQSSLTPVAEMLTGAPAGSVAELNAVLHPSKAAVTPMEAARLSGEARVPMVAPVPPAPVEVVPKSSGAKWMENWANIEKPGFEGGVPEASQAYNRQKPQGKITSKLYKKFGNMPLNIEGQGIVNAATQDETLSKVRQALYEQEMHQRAVKQAEVASAQRAAQIEREAQAAAKASKLAGPLAVLGRTMTGAGLGLGAYDAYRRYKEGDKFGAALSGGATLLGTAVPLTAPLGAAAMALYDAAGNRIEHLRRHPEEQEVVNDRYDAMGNPLR